MLKTSTIKSPTDSSFQQVMSLSRAQALDLRVAYQWDVDVVCWSNQSNKSYEQAVAKSMQLGFATNLVVNRSAPRLTLFDTSVMFGARLLTAHVSRDTVVVSPFYWFCLTIFVGHHLQDFQCWPRWKRHKEQLIVYTEVEQRINVSPWRTNNEINYLERSCSIRSWRIRWRRAERYWPTTTRQSWSEWPWTKRHSNTNYLSRTQHVWTLSLHSVKAKCI